MTAPPTEPVIPDYRGVLQAEVPQEPGTYDSDSRFCFVLYLDSGDMVELRFPPGWYAVIYPLQSSSFVLHNGDGDVVARSSDRLALNGRVAKGRGSHCQLNDTDVVRITQVIQVWP